jgi:hypothetical protein
MKYYLCAASLRFPSVWWVLRYLQLPHFRKALLVPAAVQVAKADLTALCRLNNELLCWEASCARDFANM